MARQRIPSSELHKQLACQRLFGQGRHGWSANQGLMNDYFARSIQPDPNVPVKKPIYTAIEDVMESIGVEDYKRGNSVHSPQEILCVPRDTFNKRIAPLLDDFGPGKLAYTPPTDELLLTHSVDGLLKQHIREALFLDSEEFWETHRNEFHEKEHRLVRWRHGFEKKLPSDVAELYDVAKLNELGQEVMMQYFGMQGLHVEARGRDLVFTLSDVLFKRVNELREQEGPGYLVGNVQYIKGLTNRVDAAKARER